MMMCLHVCQSTHLGVPTIQRINLFLHNNAFSCLCENIMEMENLLFWSKCSIFHNIFKSIQNLIQNFLEFLQYCLKIENDVMI